MEIKEQNFECKRGKLTIRGLVFCPENGESGKLPAVILSHGFMSNYDKVIKYARIFAGWGYAAYCFDFCGGGINSRSDGSTKDMTVFTEKEDLKSVLEYVKKQPYTDNDRIILMGCSQGGFVSCLTAAELKGGISALIMFYPAFSIPDDARRGHMIEAVFDPADIPDEISCGEMLLGGGYPGSVMDMDAFAAIGDYHGPVLIVHGTEDRIVNVSYAKEAYETAAAAAVPGQIIELLLIDGAGHGFGHEYDSLAVGRVEEFLGKTVGGQG